MALCTVGGNFSTFSRNMVPSGDLRITAKWQAVLYRCGCSKDKVSGKSLWVIVTWTGWGLRTRAGMGRQLSCTGGGRVRSTCKYQQDRTCTPILAFIWRPHPVHITTTPTVLFPSTPTYTPYLSACLLFLDLWTLQMKAP